MSDSRTTAFALSCAAGGLGVGLVVGWLASRSRAAARIASIENDKDALSERVKVLSEAVPQLLTAGEVTESAAPVVPAYMPPALLRESSVLSDGSRVDLSEAELANMRAIFDLFDADGSGSITADELQALHKRLGEPLTDAEAEAAIASISASSGSSASFEDFVKFWNQRHRPDKSGSRRGEQYRARFKFMAAKVANPEIGRIHAEERGEPGTLEYRVRFYYAPSASEPKLEISPWHNVPLYNPDGSLNFICEIPKWTRAKFEIATGEPYNPIKQDTKNGALRAYSWGDMVVNYGAFPQTWEDPSHVSPDTGAKGDNDPLDVVEIGSKQWTTGSIVRVKVLGVLALIDSGETDWKVITISCEDPLADSINNVSDVEAHIPGVIPALHYWLKMYKSASGTINKFGFGGRCQDREYAEAVVEETHGFWKALVAERGQAATV